MSDDELTEWLRNVQHEYGMGDCAVAAERIEVFRALLREARECVERIALDSVDRGYIIEANRRDALLARIDEALKGGE